MSGMSDEVMVGGVVLFVGLFLGFVLIDIRVSIDALRKELERTKVE